MKECRTGNIITISSAASSRPSAKSFLPYYAAKARIQILTQDLQQKPANSIYAKLIEQPLFLLNIEKFYKLNKKYKSYKMQKYVVLLRGINVGGNKKVPMTELKKVLEKSGFKNVKTILASGNVVLESNLRIKELQILISSEIEKTLGFPVPVLIRYFKEIEKIIILNPFKSIKVTPQTRLYITFLSESQKDKTSFTYISPDKSFKILSSQDKTVFSVLDLSVSNTHEAMSAIQKINGKDITTRNWNTVLKIANL